VNSDDLLFRQGLVNLLSELTIGGKPNEAYVLNPEDPGLVTLMESVTAEQASEVEPPGKASIAAHVDHVHYGFMLLNRWAAGEQNPWQTADWNASWKRVRVDEEQWRSLRDRLKSDIELWSNSFEQRSDWNLMAATGAAASVAHLAYHLGAVRQMLLRVR
jgi:hypothetical protein